MGHAATGFTKAVEEEHKRLETLDAELGEFEREVSRREHAEAEAIRTRAGTDAITAAREAAVSARAQLDQVSNEREACLALIPELEAASDKELLLKELSAAAKAATDAVAGTHATVPEIVELLREPLERLISFNRDLVSAKIRYEQAGLELVPGWHWPKHGLGGAERNWDINSAERQEIEGTLRRQRGRSLKAVLEGVQPESPNDPLYMLVWRLAEGVQLNQRREDIERAREQERAVAAEVAKAQEIRELYRESSIVTAPFGFTDAIMDALKGAEVEVRGRERLTQKLAGETKGQDVIRLVIPLMETTKARAALWEALGQERVMEHVHFESVSPYGQEYVGR